MVQEGFDRVVHFFVFGNFNLDLFGFSERLAFDDFLQGLQPQLNQVFHDFLRLQLISDCRIVVRIIRRKPCIERNNQQSAKNRTCLVLYPGDVVCRKKHLCVIVEFERSFPFALHLNSVACDQFLEHRCVHNEFVRNIVTDVCQLSEQFCVLELRIQFLQVKGRNVFFAQDVLNHRQEGGFAVCPFACQNEGFATAKCVRAVEARPDAFIQNRSDLRVVASNLVKRFVRQFRICAFIEVPGNAVRQNDFGTERPKFPCVDVVNAVAEGNQIRFRRFGVFHYQNLQVRQDFRPFCP